MLVVLMRVVKKMFMIQTKYEIKRNKTKLQFFIGSELLIVILSVHKNNILSKSNTFILEFAKRDRRYFILQLENTSYYIGYSDNKLVTKEISIIYLKNEIFKFNPLWFTLFSV